MPTPRDISTYAGDNVVWDSVNHTFDAVEPTFIRTPQTTSLSPAVNTLVKVDVSSADKNVLLPSTHQAGDKITVKMVSSSTHTLTITPYGAQTIDGESSLVFTTDYEWAVLESDGANWMQTG